MDKLDIDAAISVICQELEKAFLDGDIVSITGLGSFSRYAVQAHPAYNVQTGEIGMTSTFYSVRFHPHADFLKLLNERKERFKAK